MAVLDSSICDWCGNAFTKSGNQKRCSKRCSYLAERSRSSQRESIKSEEYKEVKREKVRQWKERNKARVKQSSAEYREKNRESLKEKGKKYVYPKELILSRHKQWRDANRSRIAGYRHKMAESGKLTECNRRYQKERTKSDPVYRLTKVLRARVKAALIKASVSKSGKTFDLLGMSGKDFMEYLLSHRSCRKHFTAENYGTVWVVDHIRPISSFDLSSKEQQSAAFHFTNCQPLSKDENARKGNYWNGYWWQNGKPFVWPCVVRKS